MKLFDRSTSDTPGDDGTTGTEGKTGLGISSERTESITGEEYVIEAIDVIREAGLVTKTEIPADEDEAQETDVVAGPALLEKIEQAYHAESDPILPLGYDDKNGQLTVTGIRLSDAFEHMLIAGVTGSAKSTVVQAIMVVLAYFGLGFFAGFPKGSEDADDLLAALPEHRLDDVIIIDPTEQEHTVPMNLLDVPEFDDPADRDDEIRDRVAVVKAVLMQDYGDGYINVETVIEVVSRAMMYSDEDYSFIDMFLLLNSQQRREDFVEEIDDPLLADAMREVADMEDDEVRPVLKRLMSWVLDPTVQRIISHRESALDWREVIDENKIVLLMLGVSNKSVKRLLMLLCWRQLTSAVQQRYQETGKQIPYAALLDEFDDIASDKLDLQDNLARCRAMGLAISLICQYPGQLPDKSDNSVQDAAKNNTKTAVSLSMEDKENARIMSDKMRGIDPEDIVHLPNYRCWTTVPTGGGERSDAINLKTIPPMPPLRTDEERDAVKQKILEREGVAPPTIHEVIEESPFADIVADELLDSGADSDSLEIESDETIRAQTCKAVFDQSIREHGEGTEWVRLDIAAPRIRRYLPDHVPASTTEALWGETVEKIPKSHLERESEDGVMRLRCTEEGILPTFAQGSTQNAAGPLHRETVEKAYAPFTEIGFTYEIPVQEGGEELDAKATLDDVDVLQFDGDETPKQIHDAYEEFEQSDEYALLRRLSDGETVSIEIEESTGDTAPSQTIVNLAKALNQGRRCLFVCRTEEIARKVWEHLNDEPRCMRPTSREGCDRYYNTNDDTLQIGGNTMHRPAGPRDTAWFFDNRTGEIILSDSDGEDHARFDSAEEVFSDPTKYPAVEGQIEDYDNWKAIKPPAVPERMFDGEVDPDMWDILVTTDSGLALFEPDETVPLDELVEHEECEEQNPLADF